MNRDLVLAVLALGVCGAATWLAGWLVPPRAVKAVVLDRDLCVRAAERLMWRRLWAPLLPAAAALAVLIGWGLQEPGETDELLRPLAPLLIAPFAIIWLRAGWRGARALRFAVRLPMAGAVGLVRPRVVFDPRLRAVLDEAQRDAVLAHERAHVRHRDPLRIWLAQIATDLQWPSPRAAARMRAWLVHLEQARDDEARASGIAGEDLATAIVLAARLGATSTRAVAALTGAEHEFLARVRRLLTPLPAVEPRLGETVATWASAILVATTLLLALLAGVHFGDALVRPLPLIVIA